MATGPAIFAGLFSMSGGMAGSPEETLTRDTPPEQVSGATALVFRQSIQ